MLSSFLDMESCAMLALFPQLPRVHSGEEGMSGRVKQVGKINTER